MRVIAEIGANHLSTAIDESRSDRSVRLSNFLPARTHLKSYYKIVIDTLAVSWVKLHLTTFFNPNYEPDPEERIRWGDETIAQLAGPRLEKEIYTREESAALGKFLAEIAKEESLDAVVSRT